MLSVTPRHQLVETRDLVIGDAAPGPRQTKMPADVTKITDDLYHSGVL
jgi:hypothetical protein